ncbi:MAG: hypothetical protein LBR79_06525 [Oscillospiraceae bacterium]|nr:hypothetical protein [Oscillospiraceae bacterium]
MWAKLVGNIFSPRRLAGEKGEASTILRHDQTLVTLPPTSLRGKKRKQYHVSKWFLL